MGMTAIFVMWPGSFEQTLVPLSQGGSTWNLILIDLVVSDEMFESVDGRRTTDGSDKGKNDLYLWYPCIFMYSLFILTSIDFNSFWVIYYLNIFPYKSTRNQS